MNRSLALLWRKARFQTRLMSQMPRSTHKKPNGHTAASLPRTALLDSVQSDSPVHFYQSKVLEKYVSQPISASTLRQYIFFGRQMNTDRLITSANWVRNELLVRLAHRIRDFQQLPFVVGTNPNIEFTYRLYWGAFETLRRSKDIKTQEDNDEFCRLLHNLLDDGQLVLPRLARGVSECSASQHHTQGNDLDRFMNRMLRSRISRRMLAEQHLALTEACEHEWDDSMRFDAGYVGIIYVHCSAGEAVANAKKLVYRNLLKMYPHLTSFPDIDLTIHNPSQPGYQQEESPDEIVFAYVPDQLDHILYELLSNAVRYTILNYPDGNYPQVQVTVSANETDVFFRISDQGGGMSNERYCRLWSYQERAANGDFTDFQDIHKMPTTVTERASQTANLGHVHLGIGLIISRIYAEYWSGELELVPMDGYGTDAYVRIPRLGTKTENLAFEKHPLYGSEHQPRLNSPHDKESQTHHRKIKSKKSHVLHSFEYQQKEDTLQTGHGWNQSTMMLS